MSIVMDVKVDAQEAALPPIESFKNCDYHVRISGTTALDKRVMSFVDNLWGFEVTGGVDQYEPLTVIQVKREGLARRAGIRVNDVITKINETYADKLTLAEAQELIAESGRTVKIFVRGEIEEDSEDEMTVDFWFKPCKYSRSSSDRSVYRVVKIIDASSLGPQCDHDLFDAISVLSVCISLSLIRPFERQSPHPVYVLSHPYVFVHVLEQTFTHSR